MPASSRIRNNLKRSLKLPWLDLLFACKSPSSSILPNVFSVLLPKVVIEAFVFLRSETTGGGEDSGFLLEVFRDSHEKGLVSFLATAGVGVGFSKVGGAGGGGGYFTGDTLPDRPWMEVVESRESRGGNRGGGPVVFVPSAQILASGRDFCQTSLSEENMIPPASRAGDLKIHSRLRQPVEHHGPQSLTANCTRSMWKELYAPSSNATSSMSDVTDILCAVSKGDFAGDATSRGCSDFGLSAPSLASMGTAGTSDNGESCPSSCGVEAADSGFFRSERERERSDCESGRGVMSEASSKLSCRQAYVSELSFSYYSTGLFSVRTHSFSIGALRTGRPLVLLHNGRCMFSKSRFKCGGPLLDRIEIKV